MQLSQNESEEFDQRPYSEVSGQRWSKFKGSVEEAGYQGMFSKRRLIRWCNSQGQGSSSSVDSTVTDPVFVKKSEKIQAVVNGGIGDVQLFVFTISHPSREVRCVLFPGGFSPRGLEDVYCIRG